MLDNIPHGDDIEAGLRKHAGLENSNTDIDVVVGSAELGEPAAGFDAGGLEADFPDGDRKSSTGTTDIEKFSALAAILAEFGEGVAEGAAERCDAVGILGYKSRVDSIFVGLNDDTG